MKRNECSTPPDIVEASGLQSQVSSEFFKKDIRAIGEWSVRCKDSVFASGKPPLGSILTGFRITR